MGENSEVELQALLESLQPRIRVYGVGDAGCNAVNSLFNERLFKNSYVTGYAINTDAQALLMSPIEEKILIGRTARGRGAGGDIRHRIRMFPGDADRTAQRRGSSSRRHRTLWTRDGGSHPIC